MNNADNLHTAFLSLQMPQKCQLCLNKDADKTGSHIFSFFLIRDCINRANIKRRENEIAFEISPGRFVSSYFGPEVLPEYIEKIKGKKLKESEIIELGGLPNPFTIDHILCSECEEKLSIMETFVSEKIFEPLRKRKCKLPGSVEVIEINQAEAMRIFIYSLCWRAAITDEGGFRMKPGHQEFLRKILNENLSLQRTELSDNIKVNAAKIKSLPLVVAFMETKGENTNYIHTSWSDNPYWMILNDLHFQLFFSQKAFQNQIENPFGINYKIKKSKTLNINEHQIKVSVLSNEQRKKVGLTVAKFMSTKLLQSAKSKFNTAFRHYFQKDAPPGIVRYFFELIGSVPQNGVVEHFLPSFFVRVAMKCICEYAVVTGQPFREKQLDGSVIVTEVNRTDHEIGWQP